MASAAAPGALLFLGVVDCIVSPQFGRVGRHVAGPGMYMGLEKVAGGGGRIWENDPQRIRGAGASEHTGMHEVPLLP